MISHLQSQGMPAAPHLKQSDGCGAQGDTHASVMAPEETETVINAKNTEKNESHRPAQADSDTEAKSHRQKWDPTLRAG